MAKNGANEIDMADVTEDNIKINDSEYNELEKELRSFIKTSGSEDPCKNFIKSLRKFREEQSKALAFSSSKYGEYYEAGSDRRSHEMSCINEENNVELNEKIITQGSQCSKCSKNPFLCSFW